MLKVKVIMNSVMEEVLSFKCCSLHNQNMEMHVDNRGNQPVKVQSRIWLESAGKVLDCAHLFPPMGQTIAPGTGAAFYWTMDDNEWLQYETLNLFDAAGNTYRFVINEVTEYPLPDAA